MFNGRKLIARSLAVANADSIAAPGVVEPGQIHISDRRIFIRCSGGTWLELIELQLEGKRRLTAAEFLRGAGDLSNPRLG